MLWPTRALVWMMTDLDQGVGSEGGEAKTCCRQKPQTFLWDLGVREKKEHDKPTGALGCWKEAAGRELVCGGRSGFHFVLLEGTRESV